MRGSCRDPFGGFRSSFGHSFGGPNSPPSSFTENQQLSEPRESHGPAIEEIDSKDEEEGEGDAEKKVNLGKHDRAETEVGSPRAVEGRNRKMQHMIVNAMVNNGQWQPRTRSYSFQSSTVTYGGHNGNHYTSSKTRRTGSDGLTLEESKEANTATREAASHRISRSFHNKGHTIARKLNSDGRVDTIQTLHSLSEDDVEQSLSCNARRQLPGRSGSFGSGIVNREQLMMIPSNDLSPSRGQTESFRRTKAAVNVREHGRT